MKRAISYIRISSKDQSNFSLDGQDRYNKRWAEKNNVEIVATFIDDGKSAKNFDRPDWKKLETFLKSNSKDIDYLIFIKYDRFSRNLLEALMAIQRLEVKYNIMLEATLEPIGLPRSDPDYFRRRTQYLLDAEAEWHRIRSRTKDGVHEARLSGRYTSKAPIGYLNMRDENKKPIIKIDPEKAPVIKYIYDAYLSGVPIKQIATIARQMGLSMKGNSAIPRILSNCTYAGLIFVPSHREEDSKYTQGLHESIIDEATWREVQYKLGNFKQPKQVLNEEAPLRGVLKCECSKALTGAKSKGKSKYYWYYKCNTHTKNNYSANILHKQFEEVLGMLSLSPIHVEFLISEAREEMKTMLKDRDQELRSKKIELKKQYDQLDSLEEKFINNLIGSDTYTKWHSSFTHKIYQLNDDITNLQGGQDEMWSLFETQLPKLTDLNYLYENATLIQKQEFIKLVFNSKLYYSNGSYRTPEILPIFVLNTLSIKQNSPLILDQEAVKMGVNPVCTPDGSVVEHCSRLFRLIASIKAA
jgi:DNA invertase Pin-like site-specific DNA recombinase